MSCHEMIIPVTNYAMMQQIMKILNKFSETIGYNKCKIYKTYHLYFKLNNNGHIEYQCKTLNVSPEIEYIWYCFI